MGGDGGAGGSVVIRDEVTRRGLAREVENLEPQVATIKKQETEANRRGPENPIAIDAVRITDGSLMVDSPVGTSGVQLPKRFEHLDAKLSFKYEPEG